MLFDDQNKRGIFVDDLSYIIPAKLGSNWPSSFREKIFFVFDKSEIGMASAAMLLYCSEQN